jgi:hypothetical protein
MMFMHDFLALSANDHPVKEWQQKRKALLFVELGL